MVHGIAKVGGAILADVFVALPCAAFASGLAVVGVVFGAPAHVNSTPKLLASAAGIVVTSALLSAQLGLWRIRRERPSRSQVAFTAASTAGLAIGIWSFRSA